MGLAKSRNLIVHLRGSKFLSAKCRTEIFVVRCALDGIQRYFGVAVFFLQLNKINCQNNSLLIKCSIRTNGHSRPFWCEPPQFKVLSIDRVHVLQSKIDIYRKSVSSFCQFTTEAEAVGATTSRLSSLNVEWLHRMKRSCKQTKAMACSNMMLLSRVQFRLRVALLVDGVLA